MIRTQCRCGAVRLTTPALGRRWYCHCGACRRATGAPVMAWGDAVDGPDITGSLTELADPDGVVRGFCADCGTNLVRRHRGVTSLALGATEQAPSPQVHRYIERSLPWVKLWDGIPRISGGVAPDPLPQGWHKPRSPDITADSVVSLRPIDEHNRTDLAALLVSGPQMRFVAPNLMSMLQAAHATDETWLRAIYADEAPAGLILIDFPPENELGLQLAGQPFVWRLMIDEHMQGLGLGRRAMQLAINAMRARGATTLHLGCVPGPGSPLGFYQRLGFTDTNVRDEGEMILRLDL